MAVGAQLARVSDCSDSRKSVRRLAGRKLKENLEGLFLRLEKETEKEQQW
jgi:hypothetical protein